MQLLLGTGLGVAAFVRKRWEGVLLMGAAGRLLIEPETNHYYAAGLLLGALVWDSLAGQGRLTGMTFWTAILLKFLTT